jgi:peroxiredoxin
VIGVAGRDDLETIRGFIEARGVSAFPHIADESGEVWSAFDVRSQPSFVFIDDDGTIAGEAGSLSEEGIAERLDALIAS